jgi:hypothetical protein
MRFKEELGRTTTPDHHWPPLEDQVDRFLRKLVGTSPAPVDRRTGA